MKRQFFTLKKRAARCLVMLGAAMGFVACGPTPQECVYGPAPVDDSVDAVGDSVVDRMGPREAVYGPPPEVDASGRPVITDGSDSAAMTIDEKP